MLAVRSFLFFSFSIVALIMDGKFKSRNGAKWSEDGESLRENDGCENLISASAGSMRGVFFLGIFCFAKRLDFSVDIVVIPVVATAHGYEYMCRGLIFSGVSIDFCICLFRRLIHII